MTRVCACMHACTDRFARALSYLRTYIVVVELSVRTYLTQNRNKNSVSESVSTTLIRLSPTRNPYEWVRSTVKDGAAIINAGDVLSVVGQISSACISRLFVE